MTDDRRVIVIGSGPAGAAAIWFLSKAGIKVTLLEAGSPDASRGLTVRVAGMTVAKLRRAPLAPRTDGVSATLDAKAELYEEIAPGGLTNHWSCAVPRFSRDDFADGERAGEEYTWPVGYDDLAAWYDQVEPLLHISGTTDDVEQLPAGRVRRPWALRTDWNRIASEAEATGRRIVPLPYSYGSDTTVTLSNNVFNSFVRLVKPAMRSGNVEVRFGARVQRLEWSRQTRRVEAVVVRDARTGAERRLPCRAVVLAAGAINTARILLDSATEEFPRGLGNSHDVLGRYLHDHPLGKLVVDLGTPISVHPPAYLTRPSLRHARPLYAAACVQWWGIVMLVRSVLSGRPGRLDWIGFNVFGTMPPSRDNYVATDDTQRRADGSGGLSLHIRHPPESAEVLVEARDHLVGILSRAGLRPKVRIWHTEPVGHSIHYAGTCRMHASPRFGMLDGWNRLHEVSNVVVADSSAFTTGPEKNPVLTAMTLSARASDRLARDLRAGVL